MFIWSQKIFLHSRYLGFCLDFSFMWEKNARLERWGVATRLTVTIHQFIYWPRSAQSKEHQIMAFAQLIEYDKRIFFL